jgi:1-phosphatidylinositol-3-phosphate 5-kinase
MQNLFYGRSIGHVFDLKGSSRSRYVPVDRSPDPGGRAAGNPGVLLDENFREFTRGQPLPLVASSQALFHTAILNDTQFLSVVNIVDYSIVVGIDDDTHELVVGIIDYMRQYDIIKRVERMGKSVSMIAGQAEPTIIQPSLYKNRFRTAMERYFMAVPSPWSASKIQPAPEHRTAEVSA